jgi:hypothetical protein
VNIGRQPIGFVERANSHESHHRACTGIVAPDRDAASRAARDLLAEAACRRRVDDFGLCSKVDDAIGFDHRVQREGRPRLTLAPAAMAAVDEERPTEHAIPDLAAVAAPFERCILFITHTFGQWLPDP